MKTLLLVLIMTTLAPAQLKLERQIAMPVKGRIDHMAIDRAGHRLLVAALGNNTVEVIDLKEGKVAATVPDVAEVQGVAYVPASRQLCAASGAANKVYFYNGSFDRAASVDGTDDADNLRFDADPNRLYVGYGSGAIGIIDVTRPAKIADIKLAAHPESFQLEKNGSRIFVNVPNTKEVAVIDRQKNEVIAHWPITEAGANFPMALDEPNHRVFIVCRKPAKLLALDTDSGRVQASADTVGDADDVWVDGDRILVTGGEGFVAIHAAGDLSMVKKVRTRKGARTSFFDGEEKKLYVAAPRDGKDKAAILQFSAGR